LLLEVSGFVHLLCFGLGDHADVTIYDASIFLLLFFGGSRWMSWLHFKLRAEKLLHVDLGSLLLGPEVGNDNE